MPKSSVYEVSMSSQKNAPPDLIHGKTFANVSRCWNPAGQTTMDAIEGTLCWFLKLDLWSQSDIRMNAHLWPPSLITKSKNGWS